MSTILVKGHKAVIKNVKPHLSDLLFRSDRVAIFIEFPEPVEGCGGFFVEFDRQVLDCIDLEDDRQNFILLLTHKAEVELEGVLQRRKEDELRAADLLKRRFKLQELADGIKKVLEVD